MGKTIGERFDECLTQRPGVRLSERYHEMDNGFQKNFAGSACAVYTVLALPFSAAEMVIRYAYDETFGKYNETRKLEDYDRQLG